jgi:hypothetical protein
LILILSSDCYFTVAWFCVHFQSIFREKICESTTPCSIFLNTYSDGSNLEKESVEFSTVSVFSKYLLLYLEKYFVSKPSKKSEKKIML